MRGLTDEDVEIMLGGELKANLKDGKTEQRSFKKKVYKDIKT